MNLSTNVLALVLSKMPRDVSAVSDVGCMDNINLVLDYNNDHGYSKTTDEICVKFASDLENERCSEPPYYEETNWHPSSHWERLCWGHTNWFEITNSGNDAFLLDSIKIDECMQPINGFSGGCASWWRLGTIGSNNNIGWCLSSQNSDHTTFGSKAYQGRCCQGIRVTFVDITPGDAWSGSTQNFEWQWIGCEVSHFFHSVILI
jgi:hypothetical protein